jgi:CMP-N,N'-diacetyllegionaminic acid synthase
VIDGERVVAVVPARGGSKGVPHKNIVPLGGKPLLAWPIDVARAVAYIDRTIVSTDDDTIADVARRHGAEVYRRPERLATDTALVIDALRDLIERLRAEGEESRIMVLLEATCPFRAVEDVDNCLEMLVRGAKDSVATFNAAELNPHRAWTIDKGTPTPFIPGADPWQPRQKLPPAYQLNGAVYAFRTDRLPSGTSALVYGESAAVIIPAERCLDIDTSFDFAIAETLLTRGGLQ